MRALQTVTPDAVESFENLPACKDVLKRRHLFAVDLRDFLHESQWQASFKFAFVRNPWSRLVSWYLMCVGKPRNQFQHYVKANTENFDDFLRLTSGIAEKTTFNQVDYVCDEQGKLILDFVGRFETLPADFGYVCRQLDVNLELPHLNKGKQGDYRSYYNAEARNLVAKRFERDIRTFQYSFDD